MLKGLSLLVALATAVGCGDVDTGQPASSAPSQSVSTAPRQFAFGEQAATARGNTLTVHGWVPATSSNPFIQAPIGMAHMAADVEGCAGNEQAHLNPFHFRVQMADNSRLTPTTTDKQPALHDTTLAAGDCVRGFVVFAVPIAQAAKTVNLETTDADLRPIVIKWAIP